MASRKVNTEGIDEELLIASIGKKRNEEQMPPPVQRQAAQEEESNAPARRDASGNKKQQDDDYIGLYLGRNEIKTRQCVYISRDVHSVILKIVNSIAPEDTTVGGYIDTVLRFHLQQHKDRINELYKKQRDNLI